MAEAVVSNLRLEHRNVASAAKETPVTTGPRRHSPKAFSTPTLNGWTKLTTPPTTSSATMARSPVAATANKETRPEIYLSKFVNFRKQTNKQTIDAARKLLKNFVYLICTDIYINKTFNIIIVCHLVRQTKDKLLMNNDSLIMTH